MMKPGLKIAIIYTLLGIGWILLSDRLLNGLVPVANSWTIEILQSVKGVFYVIVTGALLYFLIERYIKQLDQKLKELERLNEKLRKEQKRLEETNAELEQFAYVISHDLQEPLRMVTIFVSKIREKYASQLEDKALQYFDLAIEGGRKMRQIILDLLDYSQLEVEEKYVQAIEVTEVIEEVKLLLKRKIEETNATIVVEQMPQVLSHKSPIRMVFQNLIGNALKYPKDQQPPIIRIKSEDMGDSWKFSVSDQGIGIDSKHHEQIFHLFHKLQRSPKIEGTGIGLSLCRKIIRNMGGNIWVESAEDEGSTFHFTIPKMRSN